MSRYYEIVQTVLNEHKQVMMDVDVKEVDRLINAIIKANRIQVFGMGRMKCAVRAFVIGPSLGANTLFESFVMEIRKSLFKSIHQIGIVVKDAVEIVKKFSDIYGIIPWNFWGI